MFSDIHNKIDIEEAENHSKPFTNAVEFNMAVFSIVCLSYYVQFEQKRVSMVHSKA